jgi:hypothetical protein
LGFMVDNIGIEERVLEMGNGEKCKKGELK